jgi:3-hydroxyacyl-CoA dehydrogenase
MIAVALGTVVPRAGRTKLRTRGVTLLALFNVVDDRSWIIKRRFTFRIGGYQALAVMALKASQRAVSSVVEPGMLQPDAGQPQRDHGPGQLAALVGIDVAFAAAGDAHRECRRAGYLRRLVELSRLGQVFARRAAGDWYEWPSGR